jgi:hypothetical protein
MPSTIREDPEVTLQRVLLRKFQLAARAAEPPQDKMKAASQDESVQTIGIRLEVYISTTAEQPRRWTPWPGGNPAEGNK